jgi:hypothetical protein
MQSQGGQSLSQLGPVFTGRFGLDLGVTRRASLTGVPKTVLILNLRKILSKPSDTRLNSQGGARCLAGNGQGNGESAAA